MVQDNSPTTETQCNDQEMENDATIREDPIITCFYCKKEGHRKGECEQKAKDEEERERKFQEALRKKYDPDEKPGYARIAKKDSSKVEHVWRRLIAKGPQKGLRPDEIDPNLGRELRPEEAKPFTIIYRVPETLRKSLDQDKLTQRWEREEAIINTFKDGYEAVKRPEWTPIVTMVPGRGEDYVCLSWENRRMLTDIMLTERDRQNVLAHGNVFDQASVGSFYQQNVCKVVIRQFLPTGVDTAARALRASLAKTAAKGRYAVTDIWGQYKKIVRGKEEIYESLNVIAAVVMFPWGATDDQRAFPVERARAIETWLRIQLATRALMMEYPGRLNSCEYCAERAGSDIHSVEECPKRRQREIQTMNRNGKALERAQRFAIDATAKKRRPEREQQERTDKPAKTPKPSDDPYEMDIPPMIDAAIGAGLVGTHPPVLLSIYSWIQLYTATWEEPAEDDGINLKVRSTESQVAIYNLVIKDWREDEWQGDLTIETGLRSYLKMLRRTAYRVGLEQEDIAEVVFDPMEVPARELLEAALAVGVMAVEKATSNKRPRRDDSEEMTT